MDTQFKQIHKDLGETRERLIKLDDDIRGNGKVGINTRLDRLENSINWVKNWYWILVGAIVSTLICAYLSWTGKVRKSDTHD